MSIKSPATVTIYSYQRWFI